MSLKPRYWLALLLVLTAPGCYPDGPEYAEDLNLVYTNYSTDFDFSARKTYALPDSVVKITDQDFTDPDGDGKPSYLSPVYATPLLNELKKNMDAYGWTEIDKNSNPDVVLLASAMTTTTIYYYYDWDYWNWWYPGWIDWGWYYPGYYYPTYADGYRSGSIFLQMLDNKSMKGSDVSPVVWSSILNGLAEGSTTDINNRIQQTADQAFAQSPYLKH